VTELTVGGAAVAADDDFIGDFILTTTTRQLHPLKHSD